jgi:hypothetical protein
MQSGVEGGPLTRSCPGARGVVSFASPTLGASSAPPCRPRWLTARRARRALRGASRARVTVTAVAVDPSGNRRAASSAATLRA